MFSISHVLKTDDCLHQYSKIIPILQRRLSLEITMARENTSIISIQEKKREASLKPRSSLQTFSMFSASLLANSPSDSLPLLRIISPGPYLQPAAHPHEYSPRSKPPTRFHPPRGTTRGAFSLDRPSMYLCKMTRRRSFKRSTAWVGSMEMHFWQ